MKRIVLLCMHFLIVYILHFSAQEKVLISFGMPAIIKDEIQVTIWVIDSYKQTGTEFMDIQCTMLLTLNSVVLILL